MVPTSSLLESPHLELGVAPRDHKISLEQGVEMVRRYQEAHPNAIRASMFDRAIFDEILAQPGCAGVRMFYAQRADGSPTLVLVGVNAQGMDLVYGVVGDEHWPCPPFCPCDSPFLW